jgi:hypothetical protein
MDFSSIVSGPGSFALLRLVPTSDPKIKENAVKGKRNFFRHVLLNVHERRLLMNGDSLHASFSHKFCRPVCQDSSFCGSLSQKSKFLQICRFF